MKKKSLRNAFLAANLKHTECNIILKALKSFPLNLNFLPKDARTILQTPTTVVNGIVQKIAGGEYLHVGFKATLRKKLESILVNMLPEQIVIDFSTDGAKLNKGSNYFWPIQYRIINIPDERPIIAGVFLGKHKPGNVFEFFEQFVQEVIEVRDGGIIIGDKTMFLSVHCFIADAPARAFALNHIGHNSRKPCSKYKVEGQYYMNRMVYEEVEHPLRTEEEYRNMLDEDHHEGRSPLSPLLGLVTRVPFEGMHSLWIGNMKKILLANVLGKFEVRALSARKLAIIDSRMEQLKEFCPSEFNRRQNKVSDFSSFKATEFRQVALYTSPVVFKNVFEENCYNHFLILHVVLRLLVSKETPRNILAFCHQAIKTYVSLFVDIYGLQFLSYNVHCLLHLADDILLLGNLESFTAFCYENNMPEFRKLIRKPGVPLQQYYKRLKDLNDSSFEPLDQKIQIKPSLPHAEGPLPQEFAGNECKQFRKLQVEKNNFCNRITR